MSGIPKKMARFAEFGYQSFPCYNLKLTAQGLISSEKELQIFGAQRVHGCVVRVDSGVDHVSLLLLQENHPALNRVLDAQAGDAAGTGLANAVASICRLPFPVVLTS